MSLMKLGAGMAGVVGASGAGALGAYYSGAFSPKTPTIGDLLQREKYTLLEASDPSHNDHGSKSLAQYKTKHTNKSSYEVQELKELCGKLVNNEDSKKDDYLEARKYCVIPVNISDRLKALNLTTLKVDGTDDKDKWKSLSAKYKTNGTGADQLDGLLHSSITDESTSGDSLKNQCKSVFSKGHGDDNYDSLIKNAKSGCTLQGFESL